MGVTATANEFAGIYRGKQYHPPDFQSNLKRAKVAGVRKLILTGMYVDDIATNLDIVLSNPSQCHMTAGVHPYHAAELAIDGNDRLIDLRKSVERVNREHPGAIVAFGELGLDFDRTAQASKEIQEVAFRRQLDLIVERAWDLPLFLHCRNAFDSFIEIIQPYLPHLPRKGLVHSFVGTKEQMYRLVELGLDVSVNGFSFQSAESIDMVRALPLDRLHLETDAPWGEIKTTSELMVRYGKHAPVAPPSRKKDKFDSECMVKDRNESCLIARVAFIVAGLKGLAVEDVVEAAWRNSVELFRLPVE